MTDYDIQYLRLADMDRRIRFLETKNNISDGEKKELKILAFVRSFELRELSRDVMAREG